MNRALRAATMGVLLAATAALSACSAGQVNQTSTQLRDKTGPEATVGTLLLREVELAYPPRGTYAAGDDAELHMAVVNTGSDDDTLTGVSGPGFQGVRVTGSPTGTRAPASPSASASPTPTTPAPSSAGGGQAVNIPIPADSALFLGQTGPHITLVGLTQPLSPAQILPVTFTFQRAGQVTVQASVATPSRALPRGQAYNFEPRTEANGPGNEAGGGSIETSSGNG